MALQARAYPGEASRSIPLPTGWDASASQGYPNSIKFTGTHLYNWVERGTVRVKCFAKEHNSQAQGLNPDGRSGAFSFDKEL